ncbi:SDR family NAD(P)-dependent oxidoreductase [Algoriphagus aestuarii]|nr:SDR family NAD(P)-dependent oxidoreductase [Algoriphagus aestuarii]
MPQSLLILTGHSQGLGRAILDYFLSQELFQIIAVSRTRIDLESPRLTQVSLDLSELSVLENQLPGIFPDGDFDQIILINNAGWIGQVKPIGQLGPKEMREQVNLNLLAPMYLTNTFLSRYTKSDIKKIVCNISSGAANRPVEGWGGYCSTKAALAMFTLVAAKENKSPNSYFYSVAPGIIDTEMQADIRKSTDADFPELNKFIDFKEQGKLVSPEDVARKLAYLILHPEEFTEVIQDVRNFDLP